MDERRKAEKIMDLYVRPVLKEHFGDIKITDIRDGYIYVKMLGKCSACSSAQYTLQEVVIKQFRERMPQIKGVILDTYDEEFMDIARKILNKEINLSRK